MQKKRSPIIPILLAASAGILTLVILTRTVRPQDTVVAIQELAPGTRLTASLLAVKSIPAGGRPADAFSEIAEVEGKVLAVGRVVGDPITVSVLSETLDAGIPAALSPGTVAIAVKVDQASGVAGILRAGQTVTIIGLLSPDVLNMLSSSVTLLPNLSLTPDITTVLAAAPTPAPTPEVGPLARIVISGVRILMVPQAFQYQEIPASANQQELFASAQASSKEESVIVLEVPLAPVEIVPGYTASPAALLAALDHFGQLHLGLEPSAGVSLSSRDVITLNLAEYYQEINSRLPVSGGTDN